MTQIEIKKQNIRRQILGLCAHCVNTPDRPHACQVEPLVRMLQNIRGVPLIVNQEFRGILQVS
jgi:hypothetical protein